MAPDRFSTDNTGVTESFDSGAALTYVSRSLDDSASSCDADGYLDNGEKGLLKVTLKNSGFQNLFNTTATVLSNNPHVTFPDGTTINFSASQPGQSITASITVAVNGAVRIEQSDFTITFQDAGTPGVTTVVTHFFERLNVDEVAAASATDIVEAKQTQWSISSNPSFTTGSAVEWRRISSDSSVEHKWHVPDPNGLSDQYLVSPVMTVDGTGSFNLQFDHSYAFESDPVGTSGRAFYDGARIEMSVHGGTWTDIGGPIYNGTLINYSGNQNPLRG